MVSVANIASGGTSPLRVLVFGPPGCGKTCLAATFPRPIFLDCDGGLLSIRSRSVDYIRCRTLSDIREAFQLVSTRVKDYDTIGVDSVSELARIVLDGVTATTSEPRPTLRQWGDTIAILRRLVRAIGELPLHVIYTATSREVRTATGELAGIRPWLPGQFAQEILAAMDLVAFVESGGGGKNVLLTRPRGAVYAKDRSGKLPQTLPMNFEAITAAIGLTPATAA